MTLDEQIHLTDIGKLVEQNDLTLKTCTEALALLNKKKMLK